MQLREVPGGAAKSASQNSQKHAAPAAADSTASAGDALSSSTSSAAAAPASSSMSRDDLIRTGQMTPFGTMLSSSSRSRAAETLRAHREARPRPTAGAMNVYGSSRRPLWARARVSKGRLKPILADHDKAYAAKRSASQADDDNEDESEEDGGGGGGEEPPAAPSSSQSSPAKVSSSFSSPTPASRPKPSKRAASRTKTAPAPKAPSAASPRRAAPKPSATASSATASSATSSSAAPPTADSSGPQPCAMGCGFYGRPETAGMCSSCYKEFGGHDSALSAAPASSAAAPAFSSLRSRRRQGAGPAAFACCSQPASGPQLVVKCASCSRAFHGQCVGVALDPGLAWECHDCAELSADEEEEEEAVVAAAAQMERTPRKRKRKPHPDASPAADGSSSESEFAAGSLDGDDDEDEGEDDDDDDDLEILGADDDEEVEEGLADLGEADNSNQDATTWTAAASGSTRSGRSIDDGDAAAFEYRITNWREQTLLDCGWHTHSHHHTNTAAAASLTPTPPSNSHTQTHTHTHTQSLARLPSWMKRTFPPMTLAAHSVCLLASGTDSTSTSKPASSGSGSCTANGL